MERKTTVTVAVRTDRGLYRETKIERTQTYHDSTKKFIKAQETGRTEGRLFRAATSEDKNPFQLMNSETMEVMQFVEVLHDDETADYAPKPTKSPPKAKAAPAQESEDPDGSEATEDAGEDEDDTEDDEDEDDEADEEEAEASAESTDEASDDGETQEDDMAKKKAKKVTKKAATKTPKVKVAKAKAPKEKKAKVPKEPKAAKAPKVKKPQAADGEKAWTKPVDFGKKKLNDKEQKVFAALNHGKGPQKVAELAVEAFDNKPSVAKATRLVLNGVRRLLRGGLAKQVARGTYELTGKGKDFDPKKAAKAIEAAKAE
jgi:hypothetical protein